MGGGVGGVLDIPSERDAGGRGSTAAAVGGTKLRRAADSAGDVSIGRAPSQGRGGDVPTISERSRRSGNARAVSDKHGGTDNLADIDVAGTGTRNLSAGHASVPTPTARHILLSRSEVPDISRICGGSSVLVGGGGAE